MEIISKLNNSEISSSFKAKAQLVLLILILCTFVACNKNSSVVSPNLTKLSAEELIERARYANFPDISELTYLNEQGDTISRDSFIRMDNFEDLAFDDYVDNNGVVRVTLIRKANEKDREIKDKIKLAIREGPILNKVKVNCDSLDQILDAARESDQKNRKDAKNIDWNIDLKNL